MELKRKNGVLMLIIPPDNHISFRESWMRDLKALSNAEIGNFIHTQIYPVFSGGARSVLNNTAINEKNLRTAI